MTKKIDPNEPLYIVTAKKVAIMAVEKVTIQNNSMFENGFVDHMGGTYEVTNTTRSRMEAILSGAPMMTGDSNTDAKSIDQYADEFMSINKIAKVHDNVGDIKFQDVETIKLLAIDCYNYLEQAEQHRVFSLNGNHEEKADTIQLVRNLYAALEPVAKAVEMRTQGTITTGYMKNAFNVSGAKFDVPNKQPMISLNEASAASSEIVNSDGVFRFN